MTLAVPRIAVLDSSTLGNVSRDYWSREDEARDKAHRFLAELMARGVFIAFTMTHITELLAHDNKSIVRDRLKFLSRIQLIAWLRPYRRTWFPGSIFELLTRELHAAVHGSVCSWHDIIQEVRPDLWETGTGSEMFVEDDQFWSAIRDESRRQHEHEIFVASVARTRPIGKTDLRLGDLPKLPERPKEAWANYTQRLAREMKRQLERHGDRRLRGVDAIASDFAGSTLKDMLEINELGGDFTRRILEFNGIPQELVGPETTVSEVGELAIYANRLKMLGQNLNPPLHVDMLDVPPESLPSYVVERRLSSRQDKTDRVSGSDLGDSFLAPLVLYGDGVEVDKRTYHHLEAIRRADTKLADVMHPFFRSPDYLEILQHFQVE